MLIASLLVNKSMCKIASNTRNDTIPSGLSSRGDKENNMGPHQDKSTENESSGPKAWKVYMRSKHNERHV
ncbi:hypothetical protein L2E82_21539 [Cichorium intybus]|uniref:Uncharacterized protein n=1 Tax=Cichorium intybus TaxID=13427 RepID=A0ACB9DWX9_CICIN|nr:hypothetical protein L2E82_21539 [Cichorium intybus]